MAIKIAIIFLLSAIAVIDCKKRIIPNTMVLILIVLGLISKGFNLQTVKALLLILPLFWFWVKGKIGAGDVKLYFALAVITGDAYLLCFSMLITAFSGIIAYAVLRFTKKDTKASIALAPLIAIGAIAVIIFI